MSPTHKNIPFLDNREITKIYGILDEQNEPDSYY